MTDIVIVGGKRTAIGSFLGQFTGVPTTTLGAAAITGALEHAGLAADQVDEVIMGCVLPAGLGQAPARQARASWFGCNLMVNPRNDAVGGERSRHPRAGVSTGST